MVVFANCVGCAGRSSAGCTGSGLQIEFGDISTDVTGNISSGYSGDYGNMTTSSHGWMLEAPEHYPASSTIPILYRSMLLRS